MNVLKPSQRPPVGHPPESAQSTQQRSAPQWKRPWSWHGPVPAPNGFTILEMMVVLLVVVVLLMITLPNIQQKEKIIRAKGCEAQMEVINSQIILYEIDHDETPTDISQLIQEGYLKESQAKCPNGEAVNIVNGEASK